MPRVPPEHVVEHRSTPAAGIDVQTPVLIDQPAHPPYRPCMSSDPGRDRGVTVVPIVDTSGFGLVEVGSPDGLRAQFLPSGALFALRHRQTLINQLLPGPAEDGLFRLVVRWRKEQQADEPTGWAPLVGPGLAFARVGPRAVAWATQSAPTLEATTTFALHPKLAAWTWRIRVRNTSASALGVEVLHAQDLGLADEGVVRGNEAYVSHYVDLLPVADPALGWVILARQNQPMTEGRHPWLAVGCASRAVAFCTDGWQFYGADHRVAAHPAAVDLPSLPSRRLQYEFALAGLQSQTVDVASGASAGIAFLAWFRDDHPDASSPDDAKELRRMRSSGWGRLSPRHPDASSSTSVFFRSAWVHGAMPTTADWDAWFPGPRRHEERGLDGAVLAFFHGDDTHVVSRGKEATVLRPHGHILRSGEPRWIDGEHLGLTCYAAGIFAAQAYLGNPSLARLLSVVRNHLNVARGSGQRVFVRESGQWRQLGVPSAFTVTPAEARWVYRLDDGVVEGRAWCSRHHATAFLELRVTGGEAREFLVTHQLALGANEFDGTGALQVHARAGWIGCELDADGFTARHLPGLCFAIAAAEPDDVAALGGDELLYADGVRRGGPYAVVHVRPVKQCGIVLLGSLEGTAALPGAVTQARREWADGGQAARALDAPVRLTGRRDPAVARVDEILPWFTHNAGIHFSAPHGLEQYGGGAWGVRDVCQGSVEWLLAAGEFDTVRRILATVFARQYPGDGGWPQWFMPAPFATIQQRHSHGDVCLWPVKALCDYAEAANDVAFLDHETDYTDPERGQPAGRPESLWAHCDRVLAQCEARFMGGTALVDYGDGDWDDTLQPADPAMRTRMVSAWTVALAYQTLRQLAAVSRRARAHARAARLDALLERMRADFHAHLMPEGTVAGFVVREDDGAWRPLLHPADRVTGIRYRLLPMTRAVLAELFTPAEARQHLDIIARELRFADGVRLMSEPSAYRGGRERLFKRADTAANVGREIGLQYLHAHLRYAEAMAKVGDADALWWALQVANPVGLTEVVPGAAPRQSNVYFSSSDADFGDRLEAAARWSELRAGRVAVRAGWRLYSSGPGLFLRAVRGCLLGVRESFDDVVFDPVLPRSLDGLVARLGLRGRPVEVRYRVRERGFGPAGLVVNRARLPAASLESHPYRLGGLRVPWASLSALLNDQANVVEVQV
jgi:1,2-beta-oligoglucan phosphorylase